MLFLLPLLLTAPRPAGPGRPSSPEAVVSRTPSRRPVHLRLDDPSLWGRVLRVTLIALLGAHLLTWYVLAPLLGHAPTVGMLIAATVLPAVLAPGLSWRWLQLQRVLNDAEGALRHLARVDTLTQLHNRSSFLQALGADLRHAERHQAPQALLLIDIDHFRRLNDSHGPEAGDALLCAVADALRATMRPSDPIARWGADCFLVGLSGCAAADALVWTERVRAAIAAIRLPADPGEPGAAPWRPSASIAWAVAPAGELPPAALIRSAETALLSVKRTRPGPMPTWRDADPEQVASALARVLAAAAAVDEDERVDTAPAAPAAPPIAAAAGADVDTAPAERRADA